MKSLIRILATSMLLGLTAALAADAKKPAETTDAPSVDAQKASYPLDVCAVSSEALGSMGEPFSYVHKESGAPDRLVLMCCKGCLKSFKKDPAKYLARIDAAAVKRTEDAKKPAENKS